MTGQGKRQGLHSRRTIDREAPQRPHPQIRRQAAARRAARLEDRRGGDRPGAGRRRRRRDDRQPHHRQCRGGRRRVEPPPGGECARPGQCPSVSPGRHGVRALGTPARVAGVGGVGQWRGGARARFPRHLSCRRLLAPRRQHPAGAGGGAALRARRRSAGARPRHRLRDPGRSGEGHLPARAQDRPHRPSRPLGRGRHRHGARAWHRDGLSGRAAGAACDHHHPPVAQGRDFELEGLRPRLRRQDGGGSGRPRDARRRRALARSRRARTASSPGCWAARRRPISCRCPSRASPSAPSWTPTPRSTRPSIRARR